MSFQLPSLLDTALDRAIVPGYSKLGYLARRSGWSASDPAPNSLRHKTVLVTGANSGVGKATSEAAARLGATVLMTVRNQERGEQARQEILAAVPDADVRLELCDVADLAGVEKFAAELSRRIDRLDVLIHNAGAMPAERAETDQGHEITLATHVLGPLLLSEKLRPILAASPDPRVIWVSSGGMYAQPLAVDDPEYREGNYRGAAAYARSKRMQVELLPVLAQRWAADNISVQGMHPGWADTPGAATSMPTFRRLTGPLLRSPAEGADTLVWLAATQPAPRSGLFWQDRSPRTTHYLSRTRPSAADQERFWRFCRDAVGISED